MKHTPKALLDLVEALAKLPGVGPRSAERYAYYLFKNDPRISQNLTKSLDALHKSVKLCPKTHALIDADQEISPLYDHPSRDKTIVAVVAEPFDIIALEKAGVFKGTYHSLGGLLSPLDGIDANTLQIKSLLERISQDQVQEVILATSPSVEGESTAIYIQKQIQDQHPKVQITRLARGLPMGTDLEYADHITLGRAFEGRQTF